MNVPFLDLKPVTNCLKSRVMNEWTQLLVDGQFIDGAQCRKLENSLTTRLHCARALVCSNGTDALIATLLAINITAGDIVVVPNLTFWASYEAPAILGAKPMLIDVGDDYHLDIQQLELALRENPVKAVILPHLYGVCATNTHEIRKLCLLHGVSLIEDCAQAFGVMLDGESIFTGATYATLSFYPAKVLGGSMDGGAITCQSSTAASKLASLINHGRKGHYSYDFVGLNARMAEVNAAYISAALDIFDTIEADRKEQHDYYKRTLTDLSGIEPIVISNRIRTNHYLFPVRLSCTDAATFVDAMAKRGVGIARVYPETISQQAPAADALRPYPLSKSLRAVNEIVCLPIYMGLTRIAQQFVVEAIKSTLGELTDG